MNYTVVGLFRNRDNALEAKKSLENANFDASNINYSTHKSTGEYMEHDYEYMEDEDTTNFWDWLFGDDEDEKRRYSRIGSRAEVISVYTDTKAEAEKARDIMDNVGALDANHYDRSISEYRKRNIGKELNNADFDKNIDVIKEEMNVGKQTVETGGVSIRSRIVEKPVEENIRLKDERVYVKRNKVNKPASERDFDKYYEGTIEMTETEERPVVSKDARIVEEIEVGKDVNVKSETIKDTVRETEVDVTRKGTAEVEHS